MKTIFLKTFVFIVCILLTANFSMSQSLDTAVENDVVDMWISASVARQVAHSQLTLLEKLGEYDIDELIELRNENQELRAYVFTLDPQGYIVVTPNLALPPVLAYSFTHTCGEISDENILFWMITTDVENRLDAMSALPSDIRINRYKEWRILMSQEHLCEPTMLMQQWPPKDTTAYGGWLETSWTQFEPYNKFCPIDLPSGERSVAGCPSIAMGGILDYHQTTNHVQFNDSDDYSHNYAGNNYIIDDDYEEYDFLSFPELNGYLDTLVSHYQQQIPVTDDDLAALIFACGVACEQVYNPEGSGTFGVHQAEAAYLRFGFEDIELLDDNDVDLYDRVQANIKIGLPCHLAIVNEASTEGHNLVIDGYRTDNYYHLNFGWGGTYDGWYLLPEEMPLELTFIEGIIVDIFDNYDGSDLKATGVLHWDNIKKGSTQTGSFTIENIGDPGSSIDWEIVETPDWGTWTFTPENGEDLTPEDGPFTVEASVEVPNRRNTHYNGHITVSNIQDPNDFCLVHISLTTPYRNPLLRYIENFLSRHPLISWIHNILNHF